MRHSISTPGSDSKFWDRSTVDLEGDAFLDRAVELAATLGEKTDDAESELTDKAVGRSDLRAAWLTKWFPNA